KKKKLKVTPFTPVPSHFPPRFSNPNRKNPQDFMNAIATECKRTRHHPEWSNVYNRTQILWTTHSPAGLSGRDTQMARFCDRVAGEMGEVVEVSEEGVDGKGDGDCCGCGGGGSGGDGKVKEG
ncbi:hypothetical protein D0859_16325, partial [Hortaea werneckii]